MGANASSQTVVSAIQRALDQSGVAGSASANVTDGVTSYSLTVSGQHAELNNGVLVTQGNSETNALTCVENQRSEYQRRVLLCVG